MREGDHILVGPKEDGTFCKTRVTSLRRNRIPYRMVRAGQAATIALTHIERTDVRKVQSSDEPLAKDHYPSPMQGTVLLSPSLPFNKLAGSCWEFEADIFMLYVTSPCIKRGFQATVYVTAAMQNAVIEYIEGRESLEAGEKGRIRFRFLKYPEFLRVGRRVLFREGRTKGIGEITKISPVEIATQEMTHSEPHR